MVLIRETAPLYFDFDLPKNADGNLKHEVEFIVKKQ